MLVYACAPLVTLFIGASYVLRARLDLGRWPAPYHPDPKDLGFDLHHILWIEGLSLTVPWPAVLLGLALLRKFTSGRGQRQAAGVLLGVALWACCMALFCLDPGSFLEWTFD